jgi:hypothetical protein
VTAFQKGVTFKIVKQPRLTGSVGQQITRIFIFIARVWSHPMRSEELSETFMSLAGRPGGGKK